MVHPIHVLRPGGHAIAYRSHRLCCPTPSASFGCTTRRSQIAIEPAAPPDVSLPAIAARPLVNTASGIVQFRVQSEVSRYSDQVRFDAISGAQLKGGSLRDRLKLSGPRSPPLPLGSPVQSQTAVRVWVQQLFALGPTLEKVELSCVGVWLVFGNYGCTKHVRIEVLKGCRVNSASLPFLTQRGLW